MRHCWRADPYDVDTAIALERGLGVSPAVAIVLARRGFTSTAEARRFLDADERHDPLTLPGAKDACEAILRHVARGSRIVVHGDYDVDGVCSTAIMLRALRRLGADPAWELPSRQGAGYGLSVETVERLAAQGAGLLITVDCGITSATEATAARAAGLELIVTDHHRPAEELPDCTIVHPDLGGYGTPELCAAGVALKLVEALLAAGGVDPGFAADDLDLAALATVCDMVPLRGENRRIVREGLAAMARTRKPGLRALMAATELDPGAVDERALGFRLGPRINAAGRMQRADAALELLLTADEARAEEIATELDKLNLDRREAETRILHEADALCQEQASAGALVVAGENWHPGVVGIVASRLVERWGRPCVVIGLDGEGGGRGSGRSISAYDLHAGLGACSEHLRRFGGHRVAAGLELDAAAVPVFRAALAAHAGAALAPDDLIARERVDAVVPATALGLPLAEAFELLRPFGSGNPAPTLLVPAARLEHLSPLGAEGKHARFTLSSGGARASGVAFRTTKAELAADGPHDIALRLERNSWNGVIEPRVVLSAACPTRPGELRELGAEAPFWEQLEQELSGGPPPGWAGPERPELVRDRRGQGFAGTAGDLLSSGEQVLVAVADMPRRRAGLEQLVAGLDPDGLAVVSWSALVRAPSLAAPFRHLVALDPPPRGEADPLLAAAPVAHLAWGEPELAFALTVWRAELALRPALAAAWRALRESPEDVETALRGSGAYPRSATACAPLARVLEELGLARIDPAARAATILSAEPTDLERSATYRACAERLAEIEAALSQPAAARAAA